jgi:PIN domain nuclease of toxin-antitoxin system
MSVCLDAFALLCWLQDEPGAEVVEGYLTGDADRPESRPMVSVINLGEVFYRLARTRSIEAAEGFWRDLYRGLIPIRPVSATRSRVLAAAKLKSRYRMSYADAFAIELALDRSLPLLTGDPEMKAAEAREGLEIRWLPFKEPGAGN